MNAVDLDFASLKQKQRQLRERFPPEFGLRIHRSLSWFGRAERETDDSDAAFVFLWIAFNAAYAQEIKPDEGRPGERTNFCDYFDRLIEVDESGRIYRVLFETFPQEIDLLLKNRFVFHPFWQHHNGFPGYHNWEARLDASQRRAGGALYQKDSALILSILFDRLYVLRNQLVHGGATWNGGVNRAQVRDGAAMLACLVPIFLDLMMDNPHVSWGMPHYPVVA